MGPRAIQREAESEPSLSNWADNKIFKLCIPPRVATMDSAETTEVPENMESKDLDLDLDKALEEKMAFDMEMEMEKGPLAICEEYNACVVYLVIFNPLLHNHW